MRKWINLVESASILPFRQKRSFGAAYKEQMNEALSPKVLENNLVAHVSDIKWDVTYDEDDEDDDDLRYALLNLPTEVEVPIDRGTDLPDEDAVEDQIMDFLTSTYGFCVDSYVIGRIGQKPVLD